MAFVLVDSEAYKISLEIVEDFINLKYDDFIQKEPTEEVKIIKWELLIKFKLLENKNDSTIKYYINFFKSLFEPLLKYNSYYYTNAKVDCIPLSTIDKRSDNNYYDRYYRYSNNHYLIIDIQTCYNPQFVKFIFYCNEKSNIKENIIKDKRHKQIKKQIILYNYIDNLKFCILKIYSILNAEGVYSLLSNRDILKFTLPDQEIIKSEQWIYSIVENHYKEVINNLETYIMYCKAEKIEINFEKIINRIKYIKEYVRDNYGILLV